MQLNKSFANIIDPINANIESCLLDDSIKYSSPDSIMLEKFLLLKKLAVQKT